ncbi:Zinc finger, H2C2-type, histone UAS binding protein [Corchorus olitorius]|uniref:Zinc finger, H2C2-type, histone UAS binding protein n=1 Tax=Corchorus olitorius TaxID=93759 RepID=A0A1R3JGK3_9ROSI|nr:Zinc finger, H2C2-type, histone UAS binding protein [Corchorus olitorius]
MQLTGHIKGHLVSILIDSDSTHNLVQPRIVKHLGLPIEPAPAFLVRVDNGELLRCTKVALQAISGPVFTFVEELQQYYNSNGKGKLFFLQWQDLPSVFSIANGIVMKEERVVIPENHPLQQTLPKEFHSTLTGGHVGVSRTLAQLAANFWWKGMRKAVQEFISTCKVCQEVKYLTRKP